MGIRQSAAFILLWSTGLLATLKAQHLHIKLDQRAHDDQYAKLILMTNFFDLVNDTIADPIDLASSKPTDPVKLQRITKPELPSDVYNKKWCYGYIFNVNSQNEFNRKYTLLVYANPNVTSQHGYIWVDKNNNLDLTDDGPGYKISKDSGVLVALDDRPNGYRLMLERMPSPFDGPNASFYWALYTSNDNFLDTFRKTCRYRKFVPSMYGLRERRLNLMSGTWRNGRDSVLIGVKDNNYNGLYNDNGEDAVLICSPGGTLDNLQAVRLDKKGEAYLEWNNCAYTVKVVDKEGNYIEVIRDTAVRLKKSLNPGDKIPRFRYCVSALKPHKSQIRRMRGHMTYVYIWRPGLPEFSRDSTALRKLSAMQDKDFTVLGLNNGSSGRYVYYYNKINGTNIKQGFSSNKINKKLKIKKIPTGILMDKKCRIIAVGISPEQARNYILQSRRR